MKKYLSAIGLGVIVSGMYIILALFGWGFDDLPGFFANPARLGYVTFMILGLFLSVLQAPAIPKGGIGEIGAANNTTHRQQMVWMIARPLIILVLIAMPYCDRGGLLTMPDVQALRLFGLAMLVCGSLFIIWTGIELGRQYSVYITLQKDHKLVTSGPYRFIRHPRYLGVMVVALGLSLLFRAWIGIASAPLLLGVLVFRLTDEEKLMHAAFGDEWVAYTHRSWRLIPYIY